MIESKSIESCHRNFYILSAKIKILLIKFNLVVKIINFKHHYSLIQITIDPTIIMNELKQKEVNLCTMQWITQSLFL